VTGIKNVKTFFYIYAVDL